MQYARRFRVPDLESPVHLLSDPVDKHFGCDAASVYGGHGGGLSSLGFEVVGEIEVVLVHKQRDRLVFVALRVNLNVRCIHCDYR